MYNNKSYIKNNNNKNNNNNNYIKNNSNKNINNKNDDDDDNNRKCEKIISPLSSRVRKWFHREWSHSYAQTADFWLPSDSNASSKARRRRPKAKRRLQNGLKLYKMDVFILWTKTSCP